MSDIPLDEVQVALFGKTPNYYQADVDAGGNALASIIQNVKASTGNDSTANLAAAATFTGTGESTLGIAGIQVNFIADQPVTIRVEQSMDNTNWDIYDEYTLLAAEGNGRTFQATGSYFRVKVTNDGSLTTTYLRLQVALCPIVEALPRALSTDGRLKVQATLVQAEDSLSIQLLYENATSTPIAKNQWQKALEYTIPTGYNFSIVEFGGVSSQNADKIRIATENILGTYDTSTDTFTDGDSITLPEFASQLFVEVTTLIGGTANDVITITYTNQDGTTGRTATVTIPKNSVVGIRLQCTLQSGDYGVIDVTNVTHTQTQAGAFEVQGVSEFSYLVMTTASIDYSQVYSVNSLLFLEGDIIHLEYTSTSDAAKIRRIYTIGTLIPRT
jgi:hypothetical protein